MAAWQNSTTIAGAAPSPGTWSSGSYGGTVVHQVYCDASKLWYRRSADSGQTYSTAVSIAAQAAIDIPFDEVIVCDDKNVVVAFVKNNDQTSIPAELWMIISRDGGVTWETEFRVDDGATGFSTGNNKFYRHAILLRGSSVYHVWVSTDNLTFATQGMNFRKSDDFGRTWTSTALIRSGTIVSPGRPAMTVEGNSLHVAFTDTRSGATAGNGGETYYVRSDDLGTTWNVEQALTATANHKTLRPDIASRGLNVAIVWQDPGAGSNNVLYGSYSTDGGASWTAGAAITSGSDAAEHGFFDRATSRVGSTLRLYYAFAAGGLGSGTEQIAYRDSSDDGQTFGSQTVVNATGNAQAASVATHSDRFWIVTYTDSGNVTQSRLYYGSQPTVTTRDDFNRADESPTSDSSRWTVGGLNNAATGVKVVTNALQRQLASGSFGRDGSYRNDFQTLAYQSVAMQTTVSQMTVDGELDMSIFDPATRNGYMAEVMNSAWGSGTTMEILRYDAGTPAVLKANGAVTPAAADVVLFWLDGADLSLWYQRSGTWTEVVRTLDTTYRVAFRAGLEIAGFNDTTTYRVDDFGASLTPAAVTKLDYSRFPKQTPVAV